MFRARDGGPHTYDAGSFQWAARAVYWNWPPQCCAGGLALLTLLALLALLALQARPAPPPRQTPTTDPSAAITPAKLVSPDERGGSELAATPS